MLSSQAVSPSAISPQNTQTWRTLFRSPPSQERGEETENLGLPDVEGCHPHSHMSDDLSVYPGPHTSNELNAYHPCISNELVAFPHPHMSDQMGAYPDKSDDLVVRDANNHLVEDCSSKQTVEKEEELIYIKLKELALYRKCSDLSLQAAKNDVIVNDNVEQLKAQTNSEERNEKGPVSSSDYASVVAQVLEGISSLQFPAFG